MGSIIAQGISKIIPKRLLPVGTKLVNGDRFALSTQERREYLERNLTHRISLFLDKYSPLRRLAEFRRLKRLEKSQNHFYNLVGKIALTHAGIEQDLKNTLLVDWEVPELHERQGKSVNIDILYGKVLRKTFLRVLRERLAPAEYMDEYKILCNEFWNLSNRRNDTLKAIYAFDHDSAAISMVHEKNHAKFDASSSYEENIASWMPKIDMADLQNLLSGLLDLRQNFTNVRCAIFRDKMSLFSELCSEVGRSYPLYASKNPYLYRDRLERSSI